MDAFDFSLTQKCTVVTERQDQGLLFSSGSAALTIGQILQGQTSKAIGKIKSLTLTSGSWGAGDAAGEIILSSVLGIFRTEIIKDGAEGQATSQGPGTPLKNEVGTPQITKEFTECDCLFFTLGSGGGGSGIQFMPSGEYVLATHYIFLYPDTDIEEGDTVTTDEPYISDHIFRVMDTDPQYDPVLEEIHHIEARLLKAINKLKPR